MPCFQVTTASVDPALFPPRTSVVAWMPDRGSVSPPWPAARAAATNSHFCCPGNPVKDGFGVTTLGNLPLPPGVYEPRERVVLGPFLAHGLFFGR